MIRAPIGFALGASFALALLPVAAAAQEPPPEPKIESQSWSFDGPFGTYDPTQLQRGYGVYKRICANCHSMRLLSYRNLGEGGGPEFSPEAVKALVRRDPGHRRTERQGRDVSAPGTPVGPVPLALSE